jgi:hypothetical protein
MLRKVFRLVPHVNIILSLLLLTLLILDKFNPGMNFAGGGFFRALLVILCLSALLSAALLIARDRRRKS